jgi:hypothetical protein
VVKLKINLNKKKNATEKYICILLCIMAVLVMKSHISVLCLGTNIFCNFISHSISCIFISTLFSLRFYIFCILGVLLIKTRSNIKSNCYDESEEYIECLLFEPGENYGGGAGIDNDNIFFNLRKIQFASCKFLFISVVLSSHSTHIKLLVTLNFGEF